jgi:hypothetical protein
MSAYSDAMWEFKRALLLRVLRTHRGDSGAAARELGIHRNTMSRLIAQTRISILGIRREFRERKEVAREIRAVKLERDPPLSLPEYKTLEGKDRSSYAQKKPVRRVNSLAMDDRLWKAVERVGNR